MLKNDAKVVTVDGIEKNSPAMRHVMLFEMMADAIPRYYNVNSASGEVPDDDDDDEVDPEFGPLMKSEGDDKIELKSEMEILLNEADYISQMLEELFTMRDNV